ncbi:TPA: hypothetical protein ACSC8Z_005797 [Bacillus paranthracis]
MIQVLVPHVVQALHMIRVLVLRMIQVPVVILVDGDNVRDLF